VSTIFVAGVHAVGKTTTCSQVASSMGLAHYSASDLIKTEKANAISECGKIVSDIAGNQDFLVLGVHKVCEKHPHPIILDGHMTLLSSGGNIEAIPEITFKSLHILGIAVFYDEPEAIAKRMSGRDNNGFSVEFINRHQQLELEQARLMARQIDVSFVALKAFDDSGLIDTISRWIG